MTTYTCEFVSDGNNLCYLPKGLRQRIEAANAESAYVQFISEHPETDYVVRVLSSNRDPDCFFDKHTTRPGAAAALGKTPATTTQQIKSEDAKPEAPIEKTDQTAELLKKLLKSQEHGNFLQDETNQWLRKIRWSLTCIFIIIMLWHLFGWRIIPIR